MAQIVDMQALEDLLAMVVPEISREHIRRMVTHGGGCGYSTASPSQPLPGGCGPWPSGAGGTGIVMGSDGIGSSTSNPEKRGGW